MAPYHQEQKMSHSLLAPNHLASLLGTVHPPTPVSLTSFGPKALPYPREGHSDYNVLDFVSTAAARRMQGRPGSPDLPSLWPPADQRHFTKK